MKRDYSTFELLPQKTSTHIDSQVNNLKSIMQINSVIKQRKTLAPFNLKEHSQGFTLIRFKRRKFSQIFPIAI